MFNQATRQNMRRTGYIQYSAGDSQALTLPRVGYLARLHLHVNGTLNVTPGTGSATLSEKAPWNFFRRLRFQANNGNDVYNASGFGSNIVNILGRLDRHLDNAQAGSTDISARVYSASANSGDNTINFGLSIPIVPNKRDIMGLLLLQSEGLVTQLLAEWQYASGPSHDYPVVTTGDAAATFDGTMSVYLETFTVPDLVEDQPPTDVLFQTVETVTPVASTGEVNIPLLRNNTYTRIIHMVELNGRLNTDDVDGMSFRYNRTETPYEYDTTMKLQEQRETWGRDLPKGVFVWDFYSQGYPNYGGGRDLIDANSLAELESIFTIAGDADLGTGNNQIRTVTQQLVRLM